MRTDISILDRRTGKHRYDLPSQSKGLQVSQHRFGVGDCHVELRHRILQLLACYPDPSCQQGDHSGVACRRQAGDSRHDRGPIGCGP